MKFLILSLSLLLSGCGTPTPPRLGPDGRVLKQNERVISIESEPPGARVYFGAGANEDFARKSREYIGQTPCKWVVELNGDRTFKLPGALVYSTFVPPVGLFMAELGGTTQTQAFHGGTIATPASKAPEALFFDFTRTN